MSAAFDYRAADYSGVIAQRIERLRRLRANPASLPAIREYYRADPIQFIQDWGVTADQRGALLSPPRPVVVPFVLFPRQVECATWILERARSREHGLIEKSRDCGVSWLACALAATLCLFNPGVTTGFGSAKEDKLDRSGDPDCLFWKVRCFLKYLPIEFRGGWDESRHSAHLRIVFPGTSSAIVGEAGDNIGRGGRSSIFFVDEAAHLERPELIEASLASNTDCRIDISSVAGMANPFAIKRHSGKIPVFRFHWRDDPRKDDAWYAHQAEILPPAVLAGEVDLDYRASVEGSLIPSAWIESAVGAHVKLGITPSGIRTAALDVADTGNDLNALAGRHGILLQHLRSWSGKGSDLYASVVCAFGLCEEYGYRSLLYDSDGLGSGVRGDARIINETRRAAGKRAIFDEPYRGSEAPYDPTGSMVPGRTNLDLFANRKAQEWWAMRLRFERTHRAVSSGAAADPDALISLSPDLPELNQLCVELSQPTYRLNAAGKILVDKVPDGARSPNLADAMVIAFASGTAQLTLNTWRRCAQLVGASA